MATLNETEIRAALDELRGWNMQGPAIERVVTFGTFSEAIRFVNLVAQAAELADHHPDIDIRYRSVRLSLISHDRAALTTRDLRLARAIDLILTRDFPSSYSNN